jgi:hypothetical protein
LCFFKWCCSFNQENFQIAFMKKLTTLFTILCLITSMGFAQTVDVTFSVDISEVASLPASPTVTVFGSFNGWDPTVNPLADDNADGVWTATLPIATGDYEYKFYITGGDGSTLEETFAGGESCTLTTGEFTNRTLSVTETTELPAVCWESCNVCGFVPPMSMVTFSVNMNEYGPLDGARLAGSFNGWDAASNPMTDEDGDGIWETTLELVNADYEYKFVALVGENNDFEDLVAGTPCTITTEGFTNRALTVDADASLDTVCYGFCDDCGEGDVVSITFNVGTSHIDVSPDGIYLAGGGNFGNPGDNPMTDDDGDGVYSITVTRPAGFQSFYTFANGNCPDYSCKEDITGLDCANPDSFNDRFLPAVSQDTIVNTCFALCTTSTECGDLPATSMVTFAVNMNEYGALNEARLMGSFNGWDPGSNPMTDDDGDGVWETTLELNNGTYEYKFVALVGEDNNAEELEAGSSCTLTTGDFTNRLLVVEADATLGTVCYGSCLDCAVAVDELAALGIDFRVSPTVANSEVQLSFGKQLPASSFLQLRNMNGQLVKQLQMSQLDNYRLDVSQLSTGMYFLQLQSGNAITVRRMIKQ